MCECCQHHRKPEIVKLQECSSEQIKECHDNEDHPCEEKKEEK